MKILIDEDILEFLKVCYFGSDENPYKASSNRAYRDLNRTIRFNGMEQNARDKLRDEVHTLLEKEIKSVCNSNITTQEQFDVWHKKTCDKIRELYKNKNITFSFGQAQKWINMTFKYLYILQICDFEDIFMFLHVPLDNYVMEIAEKEFAVKRLSTPWSRCDDYKQYIAYQNELRANIDNCEPLRWEFSSWIKALKDSN
ncbi:MULTISPECIES: hypothetical protein [unclassified Ruminococcus]|uniref:hypothetical protein n=1 Tax=unclassified Ruminococcus TaxID=2608920 RepID=UPI0021099A62|nr:MULTISPECIES: hypothetical protein [unclassified Ruminococcus]MCQ4021473.1 hypothetical protein [Ruminococcus sp. zg-924]MCQ4113918.1 hypothetical protein [Ruminococcus sp. zg-921]